MIWHIHVAIPHTGAIGAETCYAVNFMLATARAAGIELSPAYYGYSLVYTARDMAAQFVLDTPDIDALLFLDADMVPPADLILRLLEADKPIAGALAFKRSAPHEPCIFKTCGRDIGADFWLDYPKGLIEIAGIGMACCLIRREVFEKTPKPWYFPLPLLGEDLAFCDRARAAGFTVWCDTRLVCGHVSSRIIWEEDWLEGRGTIGTPKAASPTEEATE